MILGLISFNEANISLHNQLFSKILADCDFNHSSEIVRHERLQLALLSHPNIPFSIDQNTYAEDGLFVFISGHIYGDIPYRNEGDSVAKAIANGYRSEEILSVNQFNGDFTIGIFDFEKQHFFLVKDHLGVVPLAVARVDGGYIFGSDMQSITRTLFGDQKIDEQYIASRFFDYASNYSYTPNAAIVRVLPGHYIELHSDRWKQEPYWFPERIDINKDIQFEDAVQTLQSLVKDAVHIRVKPGSTGAHISGGLDSGLVATLAKKFCADQETFFAFSWSPPRDVTFDTIAYDERDNIEAQAKFSGFTPVYTTISTEDYHAFTQNWRAPSEYIFERQVQQNAVEKGVTLLISGWGGDEFIGLRDEALYYEAFSSGGFKRLFNLYRGKGGIKNKCMHFVNNVVLPTRRKKYFTQKMRSDVYMYVKALVSNNKIENDRAIYTSKRAYQLGMINYRHLSQRCEDWYLQGSRVGIEYRFPLMDVRIVEYCLSLPIELFIDKQLDRPLMRAVCKGELVDEIRLLMKQADPVTMKNAIQYQIKASDEYLDHFTAYKANPYFEKVNLNQLETAILSSKKSAGAIPHKLAFVLFFIESIQNYTKSYHHHKH